MYILKLFFSLFFISLRSRFPVLFYKFWLGLGYDLKIPGSILNLLETEIGVYLKTFLKFIKTPVCRSRISLVTASRRKLQESIGCKESTSTTFQAVEK